jgi:hypothetical protein
MFKGRWYYQIYTMHVFVLLDKGQIPLEFAHLTVSTQAYSSGLKPLGSWIYIAEGKLEHGILWSWSEHPPWLKGDSNLGAFDPGLNILTTRPQISMAEGGLKPGILWSWAEHPNHSTTNHLHSRASNSGSFDPGLNILTTRPRISTTGTQTWVPLILGWMS